MNLTSVVYVGPRPGVSKQYKRRRYVFMHSKPVSVSDEFAGMLLKSMDFMRGDELKLTLDQRFPMGGRLLLRRWGALGDLLMFRAAVSAFQRIHGARYTVSLRCQDGYVPLFKDDPLWAAVMSTSAVPNPGDFDGAVSFDQVAEADHRGDLRHRINLFMSNLTTEKIMVTADDWSLPFSEEVVAWVERHLRSRDLMKADRIRPFVAVQVKGSGVMKSLPTHVMLEIVRRLSQECEIILIERSHHNCKPFTELDGPSADHVHTMCDRDALHSIEMLRYVDMAITMDSGALWMTHCAPCPVLAILGPTRPAERLSWHPMFPEQARSVCLNEMLPGPPNGPPAPGGCPACFESAKACSRKFTCMQAQPDWERVICAVIDSARSMLTGQPATVTADVALPVCPS